MTEASTEFGAEASASLAFPPIARLAPPTMTPVPSTSEQSAVRSPLRGEMAPGDDSGQDGFVDVASPSDSFVVLGEADVDDDAMSVYDFKFYGVTRLGRTDLHK